VSIACSVRRPCRTSYGRRNEAGVSLHRGSHERIGPRCAGEAVQAINPANGAVTADVEEHRIGGTRGILRSATTAASRRLDATAQGRSRADRLRERGAALRERNGRRSSPVRWRSEDGQDPWRKGVESEKCAGRRGAY